MEGGRDHLNPHHHRFQFLDQVHVPIHAPPAVLFPRKRKKDDPHQHRMSRIVHTDLHIRAVRPDQDNRITGYFLHPVHRFDRQTCQSFEKPWIPGIVGTKIWFSPRLFRKLFLNDDPMANRALRSDSKTVIQRNRRKDPCRIPCPSGLHRLGDLVAHNVDLLSFMRDNYRWQIDLCESFPRLYPV